MQAKTRKNSANAHLNEVESSIINWMQRAGEMFYEGAQWGEKKYRLFKKQVEEKSLELPAGAQDHLKKGIGFLVAVPVLMGVSLVASFLAPLAALVYGIVQIKHNTTKEGAIWIGVAALLWAGQGLITGIMGLVSIALVGVGIYHLVQSWKLKMAQ